MSCGAAQQDDNLEEGTWYYRAHGSGPRQRAPAVDYYFGDVFITGWLLYASGDLAFVQFRTMDWGVAYDGYSNYTVTALFRGHLRPAEERPPGARRLDRVQIEPAVLPNVSYYQANRQRKPPSPRVRLSERTKEALKADLPKIAGERFPKLNGKEFPSH